MPVRGGMRRDGVQADARPDFSQANDVRVKSMAVLKAEHNRWQSPDVF